MDRFWDYNVMLRRQEEFLTGQVEDYYVDTNNLVRSQENPDVILAYLGGSGEVEVTNPLRQYTPSIQYIYGSIIDPILREDGLYVSGSLREYIPGWNLDTWLNKDEGVKEIFSIIAQLYYAYYLINQKGYYLPDFKVKIRQISDLNATVPFFGGKIKTYGYIPVIYNLNSLREGKSALTSDIIGYTLDEVYSNSALEPAFNSFNANYRGVDLNKAFIWNELTGENLYSSGVADYTCIGRLCPGPQGPERPEETSFDVADGIEDIDYELIEATYLPLPQYIDIYAIAIRENLDLDIDAIHDLYLRIGDEVRSIIQSSGMQYRRFVGSDILSPGVVNEFFYLSEDISFPLRHGSIKITGYNNEYGTFNISNGSEEEIWTIDEVMDKSSSIMLSIYRRDIQVINGKVMRTLSGSQEMVEVDPNRLFVRNIGNQLELLNNTQYMLGLALAYLYDNGD